MAADPVVNHRGHGQVAAPVREAHPQEVPLPADRLVKDQLVVMGLLRSGAAADCQAAPVVLVDQCQWAVEMELLMGQFHPEAVARPAITVMVQLEEMADQYQWVVVAEVLLMEMEKPVALFQWEVVQVRVMLPAKDMPLAEMVRQEDTGKLVDLFQSVVVQIRDMLPAKDTADL